MTRCETVVFMVLAPDGSQAVGGAGGSHNVFVEHIVSEFMARMETALRRSTVAAHENAKGFDGIVVGEKALDLRREIHLMYGEDKVLHTPPGVTGACRGGR